MEVSSGGLMNSIFIFLGTSVLLHVPCKAISVDETDRQLITCNPGFALCPSTRECVISECKDIDYTKVDYDRSLCMETGKVPCVARGNACMRPCPPCGEGEIYCHTIGTCTAMEECSSWQNFIPACGFGSSYCLSQGGCVMGGCKEERKAQRRYYCPLGQVFCAEIGSCAPIDQCGKEDGGSRPIAICPDGKVFCPSLGSCVLPNMCGRPEGNVAPLNRQACPRNKVFCLSSGTCERAGNCGTRPPKEMATMCPRGYIYCLQRGECVPLSQGCGAQPRNFPSCGPGTTFSIQRGMCVPDLSGGVDPWLPDLKCPNASESNRPTFTYSTCLSNHHCPFEYSCCPDPDTMHLQCVNENGEPSQTSLATTCVIMKEKQYDTGIQCDSENNECEPYSVCCDGSCRTLKGLNSCPFMTMYCPSTKSCIKIGDPCFKVCTPTNQLCVNNNCEPECPEFEFSDASSGAPWTLGVVWLPPDPARKPTGEIVDEGIALEEAYKTGEGTIQKASVQFAVHNFTSQLGKWYSGNKKNDNWEEISESTTLTTDSFLRYVPNDGVYAYGYENIFMIEEGTNILRKVVLFVIPEMPKPKVKVLRSKITTKEEEPHIISCRDLMEINLDDDKYWSVWMNSTGLPKEASELELLDNAHWAVYAWVSSLTMPGHDPSQKSDQSKVFRGARSGGQSRGIRLQQKTPTTMGKMRARLAYSLDSGQNWETMNPTGSADIQIRSPKDVDSILIQFLPTGDYWGEVEFVATGFSDTGDVNGKRKRGKKSKKKDKEGEDFQEIMLEVESVNDAPSPVKIPNKEKIPALTTQNKDTVHRVKDYVSVFYNDADDDELGMCILQALRGDLGYWQYSLDDGATYTEIKNMEADPLSEDLGVPPSHQGLIDLEREIFEQECDIKNAIGDPDKLASLLNNKMGNDCLKNTKRRLESGRNSETARKRNPSKSSPDAELVGGTKGQKGDTGIVFPDDERLKKNNRGKREAPEFGSQNMYTTNSGRVKRNTGQARFSGFGTDNLNTSVVYPSMEALCLIDTAILMFKPANPDRSWNIEEAMSTTLMFTAWDKTDQREGNTEAIKLNVSFHYCIETGLCGNASYSWSPARVRAEWKDCSESRIFSGGPKKLDDCGVCDGDGTSCKDCNGVVNGRAFFECDICTETSVRDCAGQCGGKNVLDGAKRCRPKDNPNDCDGKPNSGAKFNECGKCVLGSTGLAEDAGKDECEVCDGKNECRGCDGKPNSGKELDLCGNCLNKDSSSFNDCPAMGKIRPKILDIAATKSGKRGKGGKDEEELLTTTASVTRKIGGRYKPDSCMLVPDKGKSINSKRVAKNEEGISAMFSDLKTGDYKLNCTFKAKDNKKKIKLDPVTLTANDTIKVVDSSESRISLPSGLYAVDNSEEAKVKLTIDKEEKTSEMTCIVFTDKGKGKKGPLGVPRVLATEVTGENEVTCTIPPDVPPGAVKLGLTRSDDAVDMVKRKDLRMNTVSFDLQSNPPEVVSAELDETGKILVVTFDQNIETDSNCKTLFNFPMKEGKKGKAPKCDLRDSTVTCRLRGPVNVVNGTVIKLADGCGIRKKHGDPSTALQVKGEFTVNQRKGLDKIEFKLTGDTFACNGSDVTICASNVLGADIDNVNFSWNITWDHEQSSSLSQSETLETWENVRDIKNKSINKKKRKEECITFPGELVMQGKKYMVVCEAEAPGLTSDPEVIYVTAAPPEDNLRITIEGPAKLRANRPATFRAIPSPCNRDKSLDGVDLQYWWDIEPEGADFKNKEGSKFTIPRKKLRGGKKYKISVTASDMGKPPQRGKGMAERVTETLGIEVITSFDNVKVSFTSGIKLDASKSRDLDNSHGQLNFRWSCLMKDGIACYVGTVRLENYFDEKELTKSKLPLKPRTLPPGKYIFTVEVSKEEASSSKSINVEITASSKDSLKIQAISSKPVVNPQKRIVIKGFVTGEANLNAWWEIVSDKGFSPADISELPSGRKTVFHTDSDDRPFEFVLPKPGTSKKFKGLEDGTRYKCRLIGEYDDGTSSFSEVNIRTLKTPDGTLSVSPEGGEALNTMFRYIAEDWDYDLDCDPLSYSFGFKYPNGGKETLSFSVTSLKSVANLSLPADGENSVIVPVVKVCDACKACTIRESKPLQVKLPKSLQPQVLGDIVIQFEDTLKDDETAGEALSTVKSNLVTLKAMDKNDEASALIAFVENKVIGKAGTIMTKMNEGDPDSLDDAANFLLESASLLDDVNVIEDTMEALLRTASDYLSIVSGIPAPKFDPTPYEDVADLIPEEKDKRVHFPSTSEELDAVRNGVRGNKRSKRQATTQFTDVDNQKIKPMDIPVVLPALRIIERSINDQKSPSKKSASMKMLLDQIDKIFLPGICLEMSDQEVDAKNVLSTFVAFRVVRKQQGLDPEEKFPIVNGSGNANDVFEEDSYVRWGPILENYTEWNCGRIGDEGEEKRCYGACLATALFVDDYLSPVAGSTQPGPLSGPVVKTSLLHKETGVELPGDNLPGDIELFIHLKDYSKPKGMMLKCFGWDFEGNEWDGQLCTTGHGVTHDGVKRKKCKCSTTGYAAVFLVKRPPGVKPPDEEKPTTPKPPDQTTVATTTPEPTTLEPSITLSTVKPSNKTLPIGVKFVIHEDYNTTVGDNKEEFEYKLTGELAKQLNVFRRQIYNLTVAPGSINVFFDIVEDKTRLVGSSPQEVYDQLAELIGSGELVLTGLSSEQLKVPAQPLDGSGPVTKKQDQTLLPIIIGAVVGGLLLIVIILICLAVYLKNKKRMDKIQPLQTKSQQPTYSSIHFDESLIGTAASLEKHKNISPASRSLSSGGTYSDEGIVIERRSTPGSRVDSSGGRSPDSGNGDDEVPNPFRYKSPTREQLDSSGPIPEHIVKKIKEEEEEALPGAPTNP